MIAYQDIEIRDFRGGISWQRLLFCFKKLLVIGEMPCDESTPHEVSPISD